MRFLSSSWPLGSRSGTSSWFTAFSSFYIFFMLKGGLYKTHRCRPECSMYYGRTYKRAKCGNWEEVGLWDAPQWILSLWFLPVVRVSDRKHLRLRASPSLKKNTIANSSFQCRFHSTPTSMNILAKGSFKMVMEEGIIRLGLKGTEHSKNENWYFLASAQRNAINLTVMPSTV